MVTETINTLPKYRIAEINKLAEAKAINNEPIVKP